MGENQPVRLGIVGCGFVTVDRHLPALEHVPEIEVVAVADRDPAAARAAGRVAPRARATDTESLLAAPDVDAVAVCTPPAEHAGIALAALEAGKHIFVEKPLAFSLEEADRLIERAGRSTLRAMVGFNFRRHRFVERARRIVSEGKLGHVHAVRTAFTNPILGPDLGWKARRELGGGALLDRAVHHFDLWRFLLDAEIAEIFALTESERADDQSTVVVGRTTAGTLVTALALDETVVSHDLVLYGTEGALFVDCCRVDGFHLAPPSELPGSALARLRRGREALARPGESLRAVRRGGDYRLSYEEQWRHFAEAIRRDFMPSPSLADGRAALEIALGALESAATGTPVSIGARQVAR